ncbi:MAG: DUF3426 domain-containing protein, partial [Phenylobacterium sp.]
EPLPGDRPLSQPRRGPVTVLGDSRSEARRTAFVLAAAAVVVAALIAGAIAYRAEVIRLWPKSSAAYAGLGLPVDSLGLVIEDVHYQPTFQGGHPVLAVSGVIRNLKDEPATVPLLRFSLLDRAGKLVVAKIARPIDPKIPGKAKRYFAVSLVDPPSTAHDLEVVFETAKPGAADPGPTDAVLSPAPAAAPAPVEAQPLPPGTIDALPDHG